MNTYKEYNLRIEQETSENSSVYESHRMVEEPSNLVYATSGASGLGITTISLSISEIVRNLTETFQELATSPKKDLFLSLLISINKLLLEYNSQSFELSHLPPIHVIIGEDESILVEWIYKDFRIGFSIEQEIELSSWYLLSNSNLDNITRIGSLDPNNLDILIDELMVFIIKNT